MTIVSIEIHRQKVTAAGMVQLETFVLSSRLNIWKKFPAILCGLLNSLDINNMECDNMTNYSSYLAVR